MASISSEIKQKNFESEQVKSLLNILFTANWLDNNIADHLKPYNLTHEQFNVLRILRGQYPSGISQTDIQSRMIAPQSNVHLIVKKLVKKAFIVVKRSKEDRREYVITILDAGLNLLSKIDTEYSKNLAEAIKLNSSEAFHLNALLDKLRTSQF